MHSQPPGTIATNLLVSDPRDLDKENSPKKDKTKKFISNCAVIAVSYFANIGLYVLINKGIRMVYTSDFDLSATDPSLSGTFEDLNMWGNWHYQADVLMFVGLIFVAFGFVSIPVYKQIVGHWKIRRQ